MEKTAYSITHSAYLMPWKPKRLCFEKIKIRGFNFVRLPWTGCSSADEPRQQQVSPSRQNRVSLDQLSPAHTTSAARETSRSRPSSYETPCCRHGLHLPQMKTRALCGIQENTITTVKSYYYNISKYEAILTIRN